MVHWMGRTRRILAMGMLAAALLGGCGSTGGGLPASSIQILEGEAEEETMAQELQKQIVAVLNVKRPLDKRMTSDAALEQAASFFLDYLLQDPNIDLSKVQNPTNLGGMLTDKNNYAFVYDGELSAVQVGKKVLDKLKELALDQYLKYKNVESIAVVYGEQAGKSLWLVLVHYPVDETGTGSEDEGASSQTTEDTDPEKTGDSETENEP